MKENLIRQDMMNAMKEKNKPRKAVLAYLLGVMKNTSIEKRRELTDAEVDEIINKQIKQTQDVLKMVPADREDLIKENEFTIAVLSEYAPRMLNEDEIKAEIASVCEELSLDVNALTGKDKGKIMGKLMPKVRGKADGTLVNQVLQGLLK